MASEVALGGKEAPMSSNWMPGVAALMGLALAAPASADPRDIYETGVRSRDSRYEAYRGGVGFENGYEDGLKRGRKDGDHGERYDVRRDDKYRDGDHGYKRSYGSRSQYVRSYRSGFEQGYNDGYSAYASGGRYSGERDGYYGSDGRYRGRGGRYYR